MSPSPGRPKKDNPKSDTLIIRLEKKEKEAFDQFCKSKGTTMSDYLRGVIQEATSKQNK